MTIRRLREIHKKIAPDITFLMETKNDDDFIKKKTRDLCFPNYFSIPPIGLSGGLLLLWREGVDITILEALPNLIDTKVSFKGVSTYITFVYGAPSADNRAAFWAKMNEVGSGREDPWLLTGDFNDILDNSEKVGGPARWEGSFTSFRSFVSQHGLWNLKHSGDHLSWRGNRYTHFIRSRLDRSLTNCSWSELFPMGRCRYLRFEGSDHRPVVTFFNDSVTKKQGVFRFNRALTENPEIEEVVEAAWNHDPLASVISKLNACRRSIIKWAKEQNIKHNLVITQTQGELEKALSDAIPNPSLIETLSEVLRKAYKEEELFWAQRSRISWLKSGDRNTGFFHAVTRQRRMLNSFSVIENEEGGEVFEEHEIVSVISKYFRDIFNTSGQSDFTDLQNILQPRVTPEMNLALSGIPSDSEIFEAVQSINAGKAPGPDGFSAKFYQAYWHIIRADVTRDIRHFFISGHLQSQQNETHIRLIPKGTGPRRVSDYRPIALCNTHYKIIAKILSHRLKPILPELISPSQSAFVAGRAIGDNVLITHETLHYLRTSEAKKHCAMAVKTDMSKAYDRMEWGFIRAVLTQLGFAPQWVSWVMSCIETVSYSFLINGTPQGAIRPSRGIRQGDPLSPYIFILCTEVLSSLCDKGLENGSLSGVRVSRASPAINHLLFADDTMFFCKSNQASVNSLRIILQRYEGLSGQRINVAKSAITFSAKTPMDVKARVKRALSIEAEGGIGKYLGLPELFGRKKRDIFAAILDRIRQKALSWTTNFLSGAGKQVLLKTVLAAMPCYAMSCFKLPKSLCKQIQSLLTRFWWDANPQQRKMCWVAWSTLTKPKHAGGLGFRDIESFNDALLAKIGWRLLTQPKSLVARVLLGKYARDSTFMECGVPSSSSHGWQGILAGREILRQGLTWSVGNGEAIRVWQDPWLSCEAPSTPTGPPTLASSNLMVSDLLCKITNAWELEKVRLFLPQYEECILKIITGSGPIEDRPAWVFEKSGVYTTRSGYGVAKGDILEAPPAVVPFNWRRQIWNVKTSPKIKDFLWKVVKRAIPVSANLAARGITSFPCKTCAGVEDDRHVFLLCSVAMEVWDCAPVFWSQRPDDSTMMGFITSCSHIINLPPTGISVPLWPWLLWNIWKARNKRCFEDKTFSSMEILNKAISDAREWQNAQTPTDDHRPSQQQRSGPPITPSPDTVVCHVDAAWDAISLKCGVGGIFSGHPSASALPRLCEPRSLVSSALMADFSYLS